MFNLMNSKRVIFYEIKSMKIYIMAWMALFIQYQSSQIQISCFVIYVLIIMKFLSLDNRENRARN